MLLPKPANSHIPSKRSAKVEEGEVGFASSHIGAKGVEDCMAGGSGDSKARAETARIDSETGVGKRCWSWNTEQANMHMDLLVHSCC